MTHGLGRLKIWLEDGLFRRIFENTALLIGSKGLGAVFGLGYLALSAQALGADRFGVLILVHTYTVVIREFVSFKSWQAVIRYGANCLSRDNRQAFQRLVKFTMLLDVGSSIFGVLIGIAMLQIVGPRLGLTAEIMPMAAFYCGIILFNFKATAIGILRLFDRFDLLAKQMLVIPVLRLLGVTVAFLAGAGLWAYLLVWFVASAVSGIVFLWFGWREFERQGLATGMDWRFRDLTSSHSGIWSFVWTSSLHSTLMLTWSQISTLAVGFVLGPASAGLFKVAQESAGILAKPAQLFTQTIYPELAKLVTSHDTRNLWQVIVRSGVIGAAFGSLVLLVIVLFGQPLLIVIFGIEFAGAYGVLLLLMLAAAISMSTFALDPVMYAVGRPDIPLKVRAATSILHVLATVFLLMQIGLLGAGFAAIASGLVTALLMLFVSARLLNQSSHVDAGSTSHEKY